MIIVKNINEHLHICDIGETGRLLVRGPNVFPGYLDEHLNQNIRLKGKWLINTGDFARVDENGYYWIVGREKDLIIQGGEHNIDPALIEEVLLNHPDIDMAGAVGQPDPYLGERPCAFVTLKPNRNVSTEALLKYCEQNITERGAVPVFIAIIDSMPLTSVGKISKSELAKLAVQKLIQKLLNREGLRNEFSISFDEDGYAVKLKKCSLQSKERFSCLLKEYEFKLTVEHERGTF